MSSIFSDGALHPGRDPNDSSWKILRSSHDWATAQFRNAVYDPARQVIELAPRGLAPGVTGPLEVCDSHGNCYRSDPDHDVVLGGCAPCLVPIMHFGGRGTATGRLRRPLGLALDDRGFLYVADSDNHRVQVVRPADGSVVIVLGCTDAWGEPVAGVDHGAMTQPVAVAVGRHTIYVADLEGHRVHVFDRDFRWLRSFAPGPQPPQPGFVAQPFAIAITADDELLIADAGWPRLLRFGANGLQLADLAFGDPTVPCALAEAGSSARYALDGEVVVGPIDGLVDDLAWHRVFVDAAIPAGAHVDVQTFASDDPAAALPIAWAPVAPIPMPRTGRAHDGELQRPVLSDVGRWQRARANPYRRARPVVASFNGDGPSGGALLTLTGAGLTRVRAGDTLELTAAAPSTDQELVTVASIPLRMVRLAARGTMTNYGAGTTIVLRERDGAEPYAGPRTLYTLAAGETIDLTPVLPDGTLADVQVPHDAAAMWRRGDVIDLGTATIFIDDIRPDPVAIALSTALGGNYAFSTVRLVESTDRLFVADASSLDAALPVDEPISVDGLTGTTPWSTSAAIHWVEPELGVVWLVPGSSVVFADWESFTTPEAFATDRGRYLWLRLHLAGTRVALDDDLASATPTIRYVRLLRPRLSYLRYLPATFARRDADDPTGALFLERMLGLFERKLSTIESRYESVTRQLDPFAADPDWLRFIAGWFDLYLDPSLPDDRRRLLVAEAHALYAKRGTPEGIRRYVEIVTGESPQIVEGFQIRPRSGLVLGCAGVIGCASLAGEEDLDQYAHRFTLFVFVSDPCRREAVEAQMRALIESIKPAHTLVSLCIVAPDARVGEQALVGVDFVLGDDRAEPHVLGERGEGGRRPHPVLGMDPILSSAGAPSIVTDEFGARIDHSLTLR
jgi:phage tail-like protein